MGAILSLCRTYRYLLDRQLPRLFPSKLNTVLFVLLNPSTADETVPDPTLGRCMDFSRQLNAKLVQIVNLYGYRSSEPEDLWIVDDPVGPDNDNHLEAALVAADLVICGWGTNAKQDRVDAFLALAHKHKVSLTALHINADGSPGHPLYLPSNSTLKPYPIAA